MHTRTRIGAHFCAFSWARFWRCVGVWLSVRCSEWNDCSVWVGTNKTLPSVYTIITMPVTALSCAGTPGSAASVHICVCAYVCVVFYNLDWPAVGRSSAHIKYLAFTAGWSGTRCKVLCGSSAFLKASSRSRGFWESSLFLEIQTKSWVQVGGLCVCVRVCTFDCSMHMRFSVHSNVCWSDSCRDRGRTSGLTRRQQRTT